MEMIPLDRFEAKLTGTPSRSTREPKTGQLAACTVMGESVHSQWPPVATKALIGSVGSDAESSKQSIELSTAAELPLRLRI